MKGMTAFKFLHTADIHLDSPLRGLTRYEGVPVEQVRMATRDALTKLIDIALEEGVAFVIIAGDLFDGAWDDFSTGLYFCGAMRRLKDAAIPVYIAYGNHDADSLQTKRLPLPENVHVFGTRGPQTFIDEATGVALHGQSYKTRDPGGDLSAAYPAAIEGRLNIGVLHTALEGGRPPHAAYAPCSPSQLASKGYDYWALGHVHTHEVVSADPYIVFPGNLQGRNIRECGPKGALLVSVDDTAVAGLAFAACDAVRWARVAVDVADCASLEEVETRVRDALAVARVDEADGRPLVARVTLVGRTALHGDLVQRLGVLREDVRALATGISDDLWIEKVVLGTEGLAATVGDAPEIDEIAGLLEQGLADGQLRDALSDDFGQLFGRIPPELAEDSELLAAARKGDFDAILQDAAAALRSRLPEGAG
jgi:DNA repair exonuclease SbcCD nuclease subunit